MMNSFHRASYSELFINVFSEAQLRYPLLAHDLAVPTVSKTKKKILYRL